MGNTENSKNPLAMEEESSYSAIGKEIDKKTKCSLQTRMIGFVVCCVIGWFLSLLGSLCFLIHHDVTQFAIFYSLGQVTNIVG